jgi:hypothetical protein
VNHFPVVYLDLCNLCFWLLLKLYSVLLLVRLITSSGHHIFWSALNAATCPWLLKWSPWELSNKTSWTKLLKNYWNPVLWYSDDVYQLIRKADQNGGNIKIKLRPLLKIPWAGRGSKAIQARLSISCKYPWSLQTNLKSLSKNGIRCSIWNNPLPTGNPYYVILYII